MSFLFILDTEGALRLQRCIRFRATVCMTVQPVLSDRCLSVCLSVYLPVCNVGVLLPNGLMDEDETWQAGRPRPWPHCVRWGFGTQLPLGREVDLGPNDIVLDGDPAPVFRKGARAPPIFFGPCLLWPNGWMDQDTTWYEGRPRPRPHCVTWGCSFSPLY